MSVLEQVYVEGGDLILHVIELNTVAWSEPIILVQDFVEHTFTNEDAEEITALPCGMAIALPKRDASGAQSLTFALDGVRPEATRLLRAAQDAQAQINLIYRCYLESDKTEPAEPPYNFIVRSFVAQWDRVEITAGLFDLIDMRWPREVYNSINTPCLKYYQ